MFLAILVIIGALIIPRITLACVLFYFEQYTLAALLFMWFLYRAAYYTETYYR